MGEKKTIARAAGLMSVATTASRVLGYLRDMVLAFYFGASGLSDTFFVAFKIPNLLRELYAEGSTSSAVIPVLTECQERGHGEARELVRALLGCVLVVVGVTCVLGAVFAPAVVTVIAPGFTDNPEKFAHTVLLTRVMFPFLFFISIGSVFTAALNTRRIFFVPSFAPAMMNISVIACVYVLAAEFGQPILAAAVGVAVGGFLQMLVQVPKYLGQGYSITPSFSLRHAGLRSILRLVLPVTFGMAVSQINIVVSNVIASFLPDGSVTYLFYSMRLIHFPIGVFGVAMGTAVLPSLSGHAARGDYESLRDDFSFALRLLFFITVPAMAGLIALREPIVATLFERGMFDAEDTAGTAGALLYYSMGIWAVVGVRVVTSTFYSMKDTRSPVLCAVAALSANVLLSLALMGPMRHEGLALAHAVSSTINFTMLFYFLRRKLGHVDATRIITSLVRIAAAAIAMALVARAFAGMPLWEQPGMGAAKGAALLLVMAASALLYGILSRILRCEELSYVMELAASRHGRRNSA